MMEEEAIIKIEVGNLEFYLSNGYYFHEFLMDGDMEALSLQSSFFNQQQQAPSIVSKINVI